MPRELERVSAWIAHAQRALRERNPRGPPPLIIPSTQALKPFAQGWAWDCRDPNRCVPLQPSTPTDPAPTTLNASFIRKEAELLEWPDEALLYMVEAGADDETQLEPDIVLCYHHCGLVKDLDAAREAVEIDKEKKLFSFYSHLPVIPFRATPRNIAVQGKWATDDTGALVRKEKKRLTTDDSWDAGAAVTSRNDGIDHGKWPELILPSTRDLAMGAAILAVPADRAGVPLRGYARDLQAAYRAWGVARSALPYQGFIWLDGMGLDNAMSFGTASSVQLFERLASLLLAAARRRQTEWDAAHPPDHPAIREWLAKRKSPEMGYAHIFVDDSAGIVIDDVGVGWGQGRARVHFEIVGEVFRAAGFVIPPSKDQLSTTPLTLGFRLRLTGERAIDYPLEKANVMRALIARLLASRAAPRAEVEQAVGILGHLTTIVAEGRIYMSACYALIYAKRKGANKRYKPQLLNVAGGGRRAERFREALRWFDEALAAGVSVPLAPRATFPAIGEAHTAFLFKDASRDWGVGGWSLLPTNPPTFLLVSGEYPEDLKGAAKDKEATGLSTGALEMAAYVIVAAALRKITPFAHLITFTDSESARGAVNAGSSPSPGMRPLLHALFQTREQHLAIRVTTTENRWADMASRGAAETVRDEALALGWRVEWTHPADAEWESLRAGWGAATEEESQTHQ